MLGLPETRLGIVPLAGGIERVAARAGLGRARVVGLGGDLHTAEEFAVWGVIDRVVPSDELHNAAEEFARRLAAGPTRAFSVVKDLIRAYTTDGVMGADSLLTDAAVGLFDTGRRSRRYREFPDIRSRPRGIRWALAPCGCHTKADLATHLNT